MALRVEPGGEPPRESPSRDEYGWRSLRLSGARCSPETPQCAFLLIHISSSFRASVKNKILAGYGSFRLTL